MFLSLDLPCVDIIQIILINEESACLIFLKQNIFEISWIPLIQVIRDTDEIDSDIAKECA